MAKTYQNFYYGKQFQKRPNGNSVMNEGGRPEGVLVVNNKPIPVLCFDDWLSFHAFVNGNLVLRECLITPSITK